MPATYSHTDHRERRLWLRKVGFEIVVIEKGEIVCRGTHAEVGAWMAAGCPVGTHWNESQLETEWDTRLDHRPRV